MGDTAQRRPRLSHRHHAKWVISSPFAIAGAAAVLVQSKWVRQMDPHGSVDTGRVTQERCSPVWMPAASTHTGSFHRRARKAPPNVYVVAGEKEVRGNTGKGRKQSYWKQKMASVCVCENSQLNQLLNSSPRGRDSALWFDPKEKLLRTRSIFLPSSSFFWLIQMDSQVQSKSQERKLPLSPWFSCSLRGT